MLEEKDLEIQLLKAKKGKKDIANEGEMQILQKYKFDNQILMKKLTEYKKAEKGAMEIVTDYEQMKMKYYNVLQENEKQKLTLQSNIQKEIDRENTIQKYQDEKQKSVDQMYTIRMDLKKQSDLLEKRDQQIEHLSKQTTQTDNLEYFQVDRHLKTLNRYMKNLVEETTDPKIIEQTLRQLKNIEKVQKEIKKASMHKDMCASETSRVLDNMFELGSDRASLPKAEFKAPGASGKKLTISKKADEVFGANNESMVTRDDISNQTKKMARTGP